MSTRYYCDRTLNQCSAMAGMPSGASHTPDDRDLSAAMSIHTMLAMDISGVDSVALGMTSHVLYIHVWIGGGMDGPTEKNHCYVFDFVDEFNTTVLFVPDPPLSQLNLCGAQTISFYGNVTGGPKLLGTFLWPGLDYIGYDNDRHYWAKIALHSEVVDKIATPTFTPPGSSFTTSQTFTIQTATPGVTIGYTLDGSTPSRLSLIYSSGITVTETTVVKAFAYDPFYALDDSDVATVTFTKAIPGESSSSSISSSSSLSTEEVVTSGLYLIDDQSQIYHYNLSEKTLSTTIRAYGNLDQLPSALAVANDEGALYYYVLRSPDEDEKSNMTIYDSYGLQIKTFNFLSGADPIIGLAVWPENGNILVGHSASKIFIFDLSTSALVVGEIDTSSSFVGGLSSIALYGSGDTKATFHIPLGEAWPRRINILTVDRSQKAYALSNATVPPLTVKTIPQDMVGLGNVGLPVVYSVHRPELGQTDIYKYVNTSIQKDATLQLACLAGNSVTDAVVDFDQDERITVITREYDAESGDFIEDIRNLDMGETGPGRATAVKIFDMAVSGASRISNVKIGVTAVSPDRYEVDDLFVVDVINDLPYIDESLSGSESSSITAGTPMGKFGGLSDGTFDSPYNLSVGGKQEEGKENESNYVAIQMQVPQTMLGVISAQMRWFFDFEP